MAHAEPSGYPSKNMLLSKLSCDQFDALSPYLQRVELKSPQILSESDEPIECAYFPERGAISLVSVMSDGDCIEVGRIGREGVFGGELLLESGVTAFRCFVQADGEAQRIESREFRRAADRDQEFARLIGRYLAAFLTQSMQAAACNGLHSVHERCCRWLLMARDRSDSDEISLTQEFLALMLGVRRASVADVLHPLQEAGLISSNRGRITILNRAGLERDACGCYRIMVNQLDRIGLAASAPEGQYGSALADTQTRIDRGSALGNPSVGTKMGQVSPPRPRVS